MEPEIHQFDRPFLVEHLRLDETHSDFTPSARLHLTKHAATSGFLRVLSGNQARILLALMTSLTPNGDVRTTERYIAKALGIPTPVAAFWLRMFSYRKFAGQPIIHRLERDEGLRIYTLSNAHVQHQLQPPKGDPPIIRKVVGREAVIDHVRSTYATHAADVEKTVMQQLGLHPEELLGNDEAMVWQELRCLKIKRADIQSLIDTFGVARIKQQIEWLPERQSKNRARTLVAALINNYGRPRRLQDVLAKLKLDPHLTTNAGADPEDGRTEKGGND